METGFFPTKGNLINVKKTLTLSKQGYELLDKKRNILIREMMTLIENAKNIQSVIHITFSQAYQALQNANILIGISEVEQLGYAVPEEKSINMHFRSVMGVEIPIVNMDKKSAEPTYGFLRTNTALDIAYINFEKVKRLSADLAEIENAIYRLATNIKRTQKRANALKNIVIPKYDKAVSNIQNALEEKEREEFTRLKLIKKR